MKVTLHSARSIRSHDIGSIVFGAALITILALSSLPAAEPLTTQSPEVPLKVKAFSTRLADLLKEIIPQDKPVRPPYDLARHDLGFNPQKDAAKPGTTHAQITDHAVIRQKRLEKEWESLKTAASGNWRPDKNERATIDLLAYAFAEGSLKDALKSATSSGFTSRLSLARLLLAECRFNEAIPELAALADSQDNDAAVALTILVRHAVERDELGKRISLLPLEFDLNTYLAGRNRNAVTKAFIDNLRQVIHPLLAPPVAEEIVSPESDLMWTDPEVVTEFDDAELSPFKDDSIKEQQRLELDEKSLNNAYLQTASIDLVLYSNRSNFVSSDSTTLTLRSAYCGPISFRLYYFKNESEWTGVDAKRLAEMEAVQRWSHEYKPLKMNNRLEPYEEEVKVDKLEEGYYLLTCGARYAPVIAAQKFAVSQVALYLRAGSNRAVIAAVDRRNGLPVTGIPMTLTVNGSPDLDRVASKVKAVDNKAFRAGFRGSERASEVSEAQVGPVEHAARAESYATGVAFRKKYPDIRQVLSGVTGADGCVSVDLDIGRMDYSYTLTAAGNRAGHAKATLSYQETGPQQDKIKALVWTSQPVYRPGSLVKLKGVVRYFNGRRVAPHNPGSNTSAEVEIKGPKGSLWKKSCSLSPAGTINGEFRLSQQAPLGSYSIFLNGIKASPGTPFTVEEFRLPTFNVSLKMGRRHYRGGETAKGMLTVKYPHGKAVIDAEVEVRLEPIYGSDKENHADEASTKIMVTDKNGQIAIEVPVPQVMSNRSYRILAAVMDASGRSYVGRASFSAQASAFELEAAVKPSPAVVGSPIEIHVLARGWDGKPITGATIMLDDNRHAEITNPEGKAVFKLNANSNREKDYQSFSLRAVAEKDVVTTTASLRLQSKPKPERATGKNTAEAAQNTHRDYLHTEIGSIDAGEELKVRVKLDNALNAESTVLIFVENTHLLAHRALRLKPGEHTISIPTDLDFAPTVQVQTLAFNGRQVLPKSERYWYSRRGRTVWVKPVQRFLTLTVKTDKLQYRPGEPCKAEVHALDWQGKPVDHAEVSLGVIHKAIYWIRKDPTPDIRDFYHRYYLPHLPKGHYDCPYPDLRPSLFWKGPKYAWGYLVRPDGAFGSRFGGRSDLVSRGGGSRRTMGLPPAVRSDFSSEAHWVANLVTDKDGIARTTFTFPDNITEWRFTARGVTANTLVGSIIDARKTMLPLQVELPLPRALRKGDQIKIAAVVHNNEGGERKVTLKHRVDTIEEESKLIVAEGGSSSSEMAIDAKEESAISLYAEVHDEKKEEADAIEKSLEVLPRGHHVACSFSGMVKDGGSIPLELGRDLIPGSMRLTVTLEPGFAAAVNSALDSLIGYPYGCVEQTMSRFMPAVVASTAMSKVGMTATRQKELPDIVQKGLTRLADFQHQDGGWGWWKHDLTHHFMTAYVLEGLALCQRSGNSVSEIMIQRAERYLAGQLISGELSERKLKYGDHAALGRLGKVDLRIFSSHALATCYSLDLTKYVAQAERILAILPKTDVNGKPLSTRDALLRADTLRLLGKQREALNELNLITDAFGKVGLNRASLLSAATLLEIGTALDANRPLWQKIAREIVLMRKGSHWGDTLVNAAAVRGLTAVLAAEKNAVSPVNVLIDKKVLMSLTAKENERVSAAFETELIPGKEITLRPERTETGGFWSARLEGYLKKTPPPPANPVAGVTLQVARLRPAKVAITPDAQNILTVKRGETLELSLVCTLESSLSYLRLSLPRPCGIELLQPPRIRDGVVAFEQRDDGLHFFINAWEKGRHVVKFRVRAEVVGTVFAPLPELAPMYGDLVPVAISAPTGWRIVK